MLCRLDTKSKMKVSIITATFNNEDTIIDNIKSILSQTHKNIEHIIIDNASSDKTIARILNEDNRNLRIISAKDDGLYHALNKGLSMATGDVVGFLHADDMYTDEYCVERIVETFLQKKIELAYGNLKYVKRFDPAKVVRIWISSEFKSNDLRCGWMPPHPTIFICKELIRQYGKFNTSYKISADYDLILKYFEGVNKNEIKVAYVDKFLVTMRVGGISNRNLINVFKKSREDYKIIKNHRIGGIHTLILKNLLKLIQFRV
jgi:glycosyltransferase